MASWNEFRAQAPEVEALVRESFDAGRHKTMATLRKDGSPRISGTETLVVAGTLWLGSMPGSLKAVDLRRDSRVAIHSMSPDPSPSDPTDWVGDAKVAGRAIETGEGPERESYLTALRELLPEIEDGPFDLFRIDLTEAVATRTGQPADHLVISTWHQGRGVATIRR